jgi:uncharacterized protein (TIGR03437 family)
VESAAATLTVLPAHAGLFTLDSSGTGNLAAVLEDGSINSASNPARRGSIVALWGTGFASGPVTAAIGGQAAEVLYAAQAPGAVMGLFQINVRIPAEAPAGDRVSVWLGGKAGTGQSGVVIAVAP